MEHAYYFAYGSNLNADDWAAWCARTGHAPQVIRPLAPAYLPDHELAFDYRSQQRNGGALNIVPRRGQVVAGVLFAVTDNGWQALDEKEGVPERYQRLRATALTPDGGEVAVTTYQVREERRTAFVPPQPQYVDIVRAGLRRHGLDDRMLSAAAACESVPWEVSDLFVYGTLRQGECRHDAIPRALRRAVRLAKVPGRLFDLGAYPGMLLPNAADQWVQGECIGVAEIGTVLQTLDAIEGFAGFAQPQSLYRRALVSVTAADGRRRLVWTYIFQGATDGAPAIASGDWRAHRLRRDAGTTP